MTELKNETIVDRVVMRLKAQPLGDLITEEDLHDIVKEAIPRTFFEKRKVAEGTGYNQRTVEKEPLIVEILRRLVEPTVRKAVDAWLVEHADETLEHWKKVLDRGLVNYVQQALDARATSDVREMLRTWVEKVNDERIQHGLQPLWL